jgi:hypothetical protein
MSSWYQCCRNRFSIFWSIPFWRCIKAIPLLKSTMTGRTRSIFFCSIFHWQPLFSVHREFHRSLFCIERLADHQLSWEVSTLEEYFWFYPIIHPESWVWYDIYFSPLCIPFSGWRPEFRKRGKIAIILSNFGIGCKLMFYHED